MNWLLELLLQDSTAHAVLILALVISVGILLGKVRFFGVSFGIAGVLFAGILAAYLQIGINEGIIDFIKDFGLILFVYSIGLQVGPGFFASLRRQGMVINLLAAAVVGGGFARGVLRRGAVVLGVVRRFFVERRPAQSHARSLRARGDTVGPGCAAVRRQGVLACSYSAPTTAHRDLLR